MKMLFNLPARNDKSGDLSLIKKVKKPEKSAVMSVKGGTGLLSNLSTATALVYKNLGQYEDKYIVIREPEELHDYISKVIEVGEVAIDTETTGLDPITDKVVGFSMYAPGLKACYVPLLHKSYVTQDYVNNQIEYSIVTAEFSRIANSKTRVIMFNAKFDTRMIRWNFEVNLAVYFDGYIACRLINELEAESNLKYLYYQYVADGESMRFSDFFAGIPFESVPIKSAYLYAAHDAYITYELYKYQIAVLEREDMKKVASVFWNIEMPLIPCVAEMEDTGIEYDPVFGQYLIEKYHKLLVEAEEKFHEAVKPYIKAIQMYRNKQGVACKLEEVVNINSPIQLAILFYDIMGVRSQDRKSPRGTGAKILELMNNPVADAAIEYKTIAKLLGTYIDKMPKIINSRTKRIHASLNQLGTDTGRTSSSSPNLQNVPSRNKEIRKMFKATDGYYLLSSDYSAQEPRLMAHLSKDKTMVEGYLAGKDMYAVVASVAFNKKYEECLEFASDGTKQPEGKERRSIAKAIVLGVAYGKQIPAIAKDLNITEKKAQNVYDKIMQEFPGLGELTRESEDFAIEHGYVETFWGRRRHLPDIQLPKYSFSYDSNYQSKMFNPFFDEDEEVNLGVPKETITAYTRRLEKARYFKERNNIIYKAREEGIIIKDNTERIAQAERQCVNSRVQGSAADQTKKAMYLIYCNRELRDLGFRLLLNVHDELIGECPKENVKRCAELLSECMVEAAKELIVPSHCDVEVSESWYGETINIENI